VLCLGLDGAGKTSVLQRAAENGAFEPVDPTNGFNVKALNVPPDWKIDVWDIGGAERRPARSSAESVASPRPTPAGAAAVRPYWDRYVTFDTRALIWVLDGSDRGRLEETSVALRAVLEGEIKLRGTPLLVLLNKSDVGGGISVEEARDALGLPGPGADHNMTARRHHVQACSAATGQGIPDGLRWLSETLTATFR
jgi:GTPase SAR1 family protein